jgi:hypothetical protein
VKLQESLEPFSKGEMCAFWNLRPTPVCTRVLVNISRKSKMNYVECYFKLQCKIPYSIVFINNGSFASSHFSPIQPWWKQHGNSNMNAPLGTSHQLSFWLSSKCMWLLVYLISRKLWHYKSFTMATWCKDKEIPTLLCFQQGSWDAGASNLTEEYRVLLFTIPKVGRTVLKQWCQRLNHLPPQLQKVWYTSNSQKKGLCYLYRHSPDQVMEMLS